MHCSEKRCCPACTASSPKVVGFKNEFEVLACKSCFTLYTSSLPEGEDAEDYDQYYSESNLSVPGFVVDRVNEIIGGFSPFRRENRLLDIGFGAGTVLDAARAQDWEVFGLEVSSPAVEQARARGYKVFHGNLLEAGYPDNYFDVITASEILEHLNSPENELREIARILRPGGLFWATTPSARGISYQLLGLNWSVLCPPGHLQLYSERGLNHMLKNAGFEKVRINTSGVNPFEIINHVRFKKGDNPHFDRVQTSYSLNAELMKNPRRKRLKKMLNHSLDLFGLGDSLKVHAIKP